MAGVYAEYIFKVSEGRRIFHHYQYRNGEKQDCPDCLSVCDNSEPYSRHWAQKSNLQKKLEYSEKKLLNDIDNNGVETFFLCDETAMCRTKAFLLEAGMTAVPELLRFLFQQASKLMVSIGFYAVAPRSREVMLFESSPLEVEHYLDIEESVDAIFTMLLQKITSYMYCRYGNGESSCRIKRLRLNVHRMFIGGDTKLPLTYELKHDQRHKSNTTELSERELGRITSEYLEFKNETCYRFSQTPKVNLYTFQVCARTRESYVVPYAINSAEVDTTPTLLILEDVAGEFQGFYQIRDLRNFLRPSLQDELHICEQCNAHISSRNEYEMHKKLKCGREFDVLHLDNNFTEVYEKCLVLPQKYFNNTWYGIIDL